MGENLDSYVYVSPNDDLVRTVDNPHSTLGGVAMRGNLAPDTAKQNLPLLPKKCVSLPERPFALTAKKNAHWHGRTENQKSHVVVIRYE